MIYQTKTTEVQCSKTSQHLIHVTGVSTVRPETQNDIGAEDVPGSTSSQERNKEYQQDFHCPEGQGRNGGHRQSRKNLSPQPAV